MTAASLVPGLQSDALAREIERQLADETAAVAAAAEREAQDTVRAARKAARSRVREAIAGLRREGDKRLARARAQRDAELRSADQRQAARAVAEAMPLLRTALSARWQSAKARKEWTATAAQLAAERLRPGHWRVAHPSDWRVDEQQAFAAAVGAAGDINFTADKALTAGLRITADQAVLDATPEGLLADNRTVAALLLNALTEGLAA
ncbi:MAG TPA: hypothetical protein VE224_10815 [Pseudolabrys sp.]|nr:hypothetical protein [Pseudolabrys sp.]